MKLVISLVLGVLVILGGFLMFFSVTPAPLVKGPGRAFGSSMGSFTIDKKWNSEQVLSILKDNEMQESNDSSFIEKIPEKWKKEDHQGVQAYQWAHNTEESQLVVGYSEDSHYLYIFLKYESDSGKTKEKMQMIKDKLRKKLSSSSRPKPVSLPRSQ